MVCWSISCSDSGLLPPLSTTERRRCRMWMKSDALMMPVMRPQSESHSGADAIPVEVLCPGSPLSGQDDY